MTQNKFYEGDTTVTLTREERDGIMTCIAVAVADGNIKIEKIPVLGGVISKLVFAEAEAQREND